MEVVVTTVRVADEADAALVDRPYSSSPAAQREMRLVLGALLLFVGVVTASVGVGFAFGWPYGVIALGGQCSALGLLLGLSGSDDRVPTVVETR